MKCITSLFLILAATLCGQVQVTRVGGSGADKNDVTTSLAVPTGKTLKVADAPVSGTDVANKTYADTALALKANAANAVFTGTLTIPDGALAIADTSGLQAALDAKAPIASPALTGTPTAPTASGGTNTTQLATTQFVTSAVSAVDLSAYVPKTTTVNGHPLSANVTVSASDLGAVVGPSSATNNAIPRFDLTTGKLIKNSNVTINDDDGITASTITVDDVTTSVMHVDAGIYSFSGTSHPLANYNGGTSKWTIPAGVVIDQLTGTSGDTLTNTSLGVFDFSDADVYSPNFHGHLSGNADTADSLSTGATINGINFDGSSSITVVAAASTLTGATLASNVITSSLTSFGASPILGTPFSGTLTNCTGLPTTGLTGTITNAQLAGSIAYSKLALTGAILNADLAGSIAASKLVSTDIATVGTLTVGATGPGFTVALSTSTITGNLPAANTAALTGDVTKTAGNNATVLANIPAIPGTNLTGTAASFTAGNATKWTTGRTIALTGDVTYTSASLDGSGNVTGAATLVNIPAISGSNLTAIPTNTALYPTLNQNTSGTAANLSGTPALPNGTTATTQSGGDNTTKLATTAFVQAAGVAGATPTGTVGLTAVNGSATTYLRSDGAPALSQSIAPTWTAAHIYSVAGAASVPAIKISGVPFAGTGTTSFPLVYINDASATASTTLSTAGTYFGVNGHGTADLFNFINDGSSRLKVSSTGIVSMAGNITSSSTTTGTAVITGGLGVSGAIYSNSWNSSDGNTSIASDVASRVVSASNSFRLSSGTHDFNINQDTSLSRNAAGIWQMGTNASGSANNALGTLFLANLTSSNQITSSVSTGTAPFVVTSTTRVSNLNVATAGTADTLTTARTINGVSFNGSANVTIPISGHIIGTGSAPTIAAGAGDGTGGTVSISGTSTDTAGEITFTTGTLPTVNSVIATITFSSAYGTSPYVVLWPAEANASGLGFLPYATGSTTTFTVSNAVSLGLVGSTTYKYNYHVIQ